MYRKPRYDKEQFKFSNDWYEIEMTLTTRVFWGLISLSTSVLQLTKPSEIFQKNDYAEIITI